MLRAEVGGAAGEDLPQPVHIPLELLRPLVVQLHTVLTDITADSDLILALLGHSLEWDLLIYLRLLGELLFRRPLSLGPPAEELDPLGDDLDDLLPLTLLGLEGVDP